MNNVLTITWLTFHEARRRKMVLAALIMGVLFLVLYVVGFSFILSQASTATAGRTPTPIQDAQLTLGLNFLTLAGLYVVHFLTIMLAIFASVDTVSGEITSHTIQAIATKPVRRWEIIVGKWLGQAAMIVPYLALLTGGILLAVRVIANYVPSNVPAVIGLIVLQSVVLLSLSLLGGTRLSTLTNGVALFMLYGLAFIGSWIEQIGSLLNSEAAVNIGIVTSLVMPVEALWRICAGILSPSLMTVDKRFSIMFGAAAQPSGAMVAYAAVYALAVLGLAIWQFNKRDL